LDFEAAVENKVEESLWEAHQKVNTKFRRNLEQFRDAEGQKRKVERRKAEKLYVQFIKSSQSFYRGYIQCLASTFQGIPEIELLAHDMDLSSQSQCLVAQMYANLPAALSAGTPQDVSLGLEQHLVNSCYTALVYLGDLSRYRETELKSDKRNWGPAVGYYQKAARFKPSDGNAYNQLAMVASKDKDHLRMVYQLYQAICLKHPFPMSQKNLDSEFKRLRTKAKQRKAILENVEVFTGNARLYEQFLIFHASTWDEHTDDQEPLQLEILQLLGEEIREQADATILRKFSLVNLAAEKCASDRMTGMLDHLPACTSSKLTTASRSN
jgi:tetratricopeptide (TPR) repeat protein